MTNAESAEVLKLILNIIHMHRGDSKPGIKMIYIEALCKAIAALKKGE